MKEAMEEVKAALGDDAVILHTKKYKEGSTLGMGGQEVVEVTAAIEDEPDMPQERARRVVPEEPVRLNLQPRSVLGQYKTNGTAEGVRLASSPISPPPEEVLHPQVANSESLTGKRVGEVLEQEALQQRVESSHTQELRPPQNLQRAVTPTGSVPSLQPQVVEQVPEKGPAPQLGEIQRAPMPVPQSVPPQTPAVMPVAPVRPQPEGAAPAPVPPEKRPPHPQLQPVERPQAGPATVPPAPAEGKDKEDVEEKREESAKIQRLEEELAQMKTLLAQVMSKDQPEDKLTLDEILRRQEVAPEILEDMAAKLPAGATLLDSLDPKAREALESYLDQALHFVDGIELNKHGVRTVALIGTTGVGKTTTLAKIAARFVLERGVKAALITADTYRISAVDQLKTYSDILGLPIEIVYTPEELKVAIHKHRSKDLILIDTAGRSQNNEFQMKELGELLSINKNIEIHLVMSATTKGRDAEIILDKFSACKPSRVIFTKTDETASAGMLLNLLKGKDIALSFLTTGQSVPDDILPANAKNLADLLLRE